MPILIFKLLGLMGTIKRIAVAGFQWVFASTTRILIALCLILAAVGLYQRHKANEWHVAYTEAAEALKTQQKAYRAASEGARAAAIAQVKAVEARSAQLAKDADYEHRIALNSARSRVDDYARRMRIENGLRCGDATPAPERENPGVPADLPADTGMVAISRTDLQDLADWVAFGVKEHNRAVDKINAGLAEPVRESDLPSVGF